MMILDIADKDGDGRLTQDEVRQFISLIASANNMSTIENKADEYATQIMEEFDPDEFGYITLEGFKMLLEELETQCVTTSTDETEKSTMLNRNTIKKWYNLLKK
ncbi:PREDICTED: respiratory burst oxidase homolog protein C-like [Camelina sativa]|uniref:Respiratory burst oxidase homolog protein C-like n=1 Tax=Camelina sativa TaxID=90675 RepID=A0ABM0Z557_CAMSA|nr:PREDICTED: respiratory burst oxidase homolog protein C-like [Camelina sativa]